MPKVEKYNLNEETFNFILDIERKIEKGKVYTNRELVQLFESSSFYNDVVQSYYRTAMQKSIWWAVKRSNSWLIERGKYTKL
ncbi:hypothetical protein BBD41_09935 [Paenibacillus ihbetae]|uniref:Uncharacterized protein n=1 Tax=Paenibacillus ihbetae TaxID=1870820 RepID=A0A1B2DYY4_9BACL|nr:hypothetical protein [Paenibacillus ihbetae]ANY72882.1 hypothetical protein BBD41_09935 [Paenibacillus ihbetae]